MKFGPFKVKTIEGLQAAFRQLSVGLHSLSTENFSKRGVKEQVLNLEIGTWDLQMSGGFVSSLDEVYVAQYVLLHHLVFINFKVEFTTGGTPSDQVIVSLPFVVKAAEQTTQLQEMAIAINDGGGGPETGIGLFTKETTDLVCLKTSNYTAGGGEIISGNGFYFREI